MRGTSGSNRAALYRVMLFASLSVIVVVSLGMFDVFAYAYSEVTTAYYLSDLTNVWADGVATVFGPCIGFILMLLCFRVSVAKEIEISKSGTSSTSSVSSSKSSSATSSADPVIEL